MKRRSLMLGAAAGFGGLVLPLQGFASGRGPQTLQSQTLRFQI